MRKKVPGVELSDTEFWSCRSSQDKKEETQTKKKKKRRKKGLKIIVEEVMVTCRVKALRDGAELRKSTDVQINSNSYQEG